MAKKKRQQTVKANEVTKGNKQTKTNVKSSQNNQIEVLPSNLLDSSPKRKTNLQVETLYENAVYIARNFFTAKECQAWIDFVESSNELEYMASPGTRYMANRECSRWQRDDWNIADRIYDRMKKIVLDRIHPAFDMPAGYQPVTCNGNLRFYKYEKGMKFGKHIDGSNNTRKGQTEVTILIYLSDCKGGATRFYPPFSKKKDKGSFAFQPESGAILFHVHGDRCLEHEADAVISGVKYVLRTDLVYSADFDSYYSPLGL